MSYKLPIIPPAFPVFCQREIPLTFDNSESYLEFVAHINAKLNEVIKAVNAQNLAFNDVVNIINKTFETFKEYVENEIAEYKEEIFGALDDLRAELVDRISAVEDDVEENTKDINSLFIEKGTLDYTPKYNAGTVEITSDIMNAKCDIYYKNPLSDIYHPWKSETTIADYIAETTAEDVGERELLFMFWNFKFPAGGYVTASYPTFDTDCFMQIYSRANIPEEDFNTGLTAYGDVTQSGTGSITVRVDVVENVPAVNCLFISNQFALNWLTAVIPLRAYTTQKIAELYSRENGEKVFPLIKFDSTLRLDEQGRLSVVSAMPADLPHNLAYLKEDDTLYKIIDENNVEVDLFINHDESLSQNNGVLGVSNSILDNLTNLNSRMNQLVLNPYNLQEFEIGAIDGTGHLSTNDARIRTKTFLNITNLSAITAKNGCKIFLVAYANTSYYGQWENHVNPGGWNGSTFGELTGAWVDSVNIGDISTLYPTYKYGLALRYGDNRTVTDINDLLSNFEFVQLANVGEITTEVFLPIQIENLCKVYNQAGKYFAKIPNNYITKTNGVNVFIDPNGNDTNTGLTVNSPFKTIEKCLTISNVQSIIFLPGTYTNGINFTSNLEITTSLNFIGINEVTIDNGSGLNNSPINFKSSAFVKNIKFTHGNNTVKATLTANDLITFENCVFCDSDNNTYSNGLAILGGKAIVNKCVAYNNSFDGFNYHENGTVINQTFEIDCTSYNNGLTALTAADGQSSNATTTHNGSKIVRVNGDYYNCHGGVVADLNAESANFGCKSGISTVTDSTNYADRMSNYWCSGGAMYLYDCDSYSSKYDTSSVNHGSISSNVYYSSNYVE